MTQSRVSATHWSLTFIYGRRLWIETLEEGFERVFNNPCTPPGGFEDDKKQNVVNILQVCCIEDETPLVCFR